jgi:hypothetical protein
VSVSQDVVLQAWLDRQAIHDLIFRYSDAVTRADYDRVITVFASDAVWESPLLEMRFDSARAFVDYLIEGTASLDVLIQTPHSPVIELLGAERATATTTIHEMVRGTATTAGMHGEIGTEINVDQYGIYHDRVAKVDGARPGGRRRFEQSAVAPRQVRLTVDADRSAVPCA